VRLRLCLFLALLLASCRPDSGPFPGDSYTDPDTGSTISVVAVGSCDVVREEAPTVDEGPVDTTAVRRIEDLTLLELGDPTSCVAFSAAPEEVVIASRTAFLDRFRLVDQLVPAD
jgi:hypothetical protein